MTSGNLEKPMTPAAERLLTLAFRPFAANAEQRLAAEAMLREAVEENEADARGIAEATASFERADRKSRWRYGRAALVTVMLLISLPLLFMTSREIIQLRQLLRFSSNMGVDSVDTGFPGLSHSQDLLLFGDRNAPNEALKWKPLWDSDPVNPAYLAQYAAGYYRDNKRLSPEILEAAERLDPDNGWFRGLDIAGRADGLVTKKSKPYTPRGTPPTTPVWDVKDEAGLRNALAAIHEMAQKTKIVSYESDLLSERIPLLPQRRDVASQLPTITYLASQTSSVIAFRKLVDLLAAGAQQAASQGDVAGFRQIVSDWRALAPILARDGNTMIDLLVAKVFFFATRNFRDAARDLGLVDEEKRFAAIYDLGQKEKVDREAAGRSRGDGLEPLRGSVIQVLMAPMLDRQVMNPPPVTEGELRPGRYAEFALIERVAIWGAWLVLGFCVCVSCGSRFSRNQVSRGLATRMVDLLRPSDWAWIGLGGILLPIAWYVFFTRFTPLSAREWSMRATSFMQFGGQFGFLILALVIFPGLLINWRLKRRGAAVLGMKRAASWPNWCAAGFVLAGVPIFGLVMLWPQLGLSLENLAMFALCAAGIWLLVVAGLHLFGPSGQALRRATQARAVWPLWIVSMSILALFTLLDHAEERHWIQRDTIFRMSADRPALSRQEYEVTQILRTELMEMIVDAEKIDGSPRRKMPRILHDLPPTLPP